MNQGIPDIHGSPALHRKVDRFDICCSTAERPPKSAPLKNEAAPLTRLKEFLCPSALSFLKQIIKTLLAEKSYSSAVLYTASKITSANRINTAGVSISQRSASSTSTATSIQIREKIRSSRYSDNFIRNTLNHVSFPDSPADRFRSVLSVTERC